LKASPRVPPGHRVSWPHAEEKEEEFVFVLEGEIDAWIDGALYRMKRGDLAAFPAGTGICHTFLNNGKHEATLLREILTTARSLAWRAPTHRELVANVGISTSIFCANCYRVADVSRMFAVTVENPFRSSRRSTHRGRLAPMSH
jgi:hypothetical protein